MGAASWLKGRHLAMSSNGTIASEKRKVGAPDHQLRGLVRPVAPVAGAKRVTLPATTNTTNRRRGHGEDAIYLDPAKSRYMGAVSLG
jgi:hypothetical protein